MNNLFQDKHIWTVSELTRDLRAILEDSFPNIWVEGEISNLRAPQSGHLYFTLKDDKAQLKCVFFKNSNSKLDFKIEDGLSCIIFGRISVYERDGQYQLYVEKVEPRGKGALQLAFEQLKKKLEAQGLFDKARKRPIPLLPERIGIVTSPTGAAIRDILNIINRRYANIQIIIRPALVQGKTAAGDIARGIKELNEYGWLDVIIVARGGGSLEDLWPFNEEVVARAVSNSKLPVISAVGHEIDFTICDFVADLRAATPSAAAELVVKEKAQLILNLQNTSKRLSDIIRQKLNFLEMRFSRAVKVYELRRPERIIEQYQQRLDNLDKTIKTAFAHFIKIKGEQLKNISARLANLNPLGVLARGYSVTYLNNEGVILKNAKSVKNDDLLKTVLHKGVIISKVERCE